MILDEKIENLATSALLDESQFVVGVVVSSKVGPRKITVVLDGDKGITIDDCAAVSRKLLVTLEEEGEVGDNFTLEVTTPGVDHPLKMKRQYVKNIGRTMKIQLKDKAIESGKLIAIDGEAIELEQEQGKNKPVKKTVVPFADIERATVQISFK